MKVEKKKIYQSAPLPFMGQKRMFIKEFRNVLKEFPDDAVYVDYLEDAQAKLAQTLETCWDEDRFIRGIREDGVIVGAKKDPEANMWLNPQSWSVISGFASKEQADTAMQSVADILDTPYGAKLLEPPYRHHYFDGALMHIFNLDTKENGV